MALSVGEVEAVYKLVNQFSAPAQEILNQMAELERSMATMQAKAAETTKPVDDMTRGMFGTGVAAEETSGVMGRLGGMITAVGQSTTNFGGILSGALANPLGAVRTVLGSVANMLGPFGVGLAAVGGVAGVVGKQLFDLAMNAANTGEYIGDIADKTGMSVPALSRLHNAAQVAGTSLETISNIMFILQRNMAAGGRAYEDALEILGLTTAELKAAGDNILPLVISKLEGLRDVSQQNEAGQALLGRAFRTSKADLFDLAKAMDMTSDITPWTQEQADMAEDFQMQVKNVSIHLQAWTNQVGIYLIPVMSTLVDLTVAVAKGIGILTGVTGMFLVLRDAVKHASAALDVLLDRTGKLPEEHGDAKKALDEYKDSLNDLGIKVPTADDAMENWRKTNEKANEVAREAAEKLREQEQATRKAKEEADKLNATYAALVRPTRDVMFLQSDLNSVLGVAAMETLPAHIARTHEFDRAVRISEATLRDIGVVVEEQPRKFFNLGAAMHQAFGSIGDILNNISGKFAEVGAIAARTITGIMDAVASGNPLGIVGSIVTGIAGLFSKLGPGKEVEEKWRKIREEQERAVEAFKEMDKTRSIFIAVEGGIDSLARKAAEAGVTLEKMLDASTPEEYQEAIEELTGAFNFQEQAMDMLDDAVERYGFTIEELGPKFNKQKLHQQAVDLLRDYEILTAAGIDHNAIIARMAPTLQGYVDASLKAGIAIPKQMEPILQSMIEQGLLTDENGEKLTDLSKLTFEETLEAKFQTLIDKISEFVDAITRGLNPALLSIPTPKAPWADWPPMPTGVSGGGGTGGGGGADEGSYGSRGGLVTRNGIVYAGMGALVRGTDTVPAMLTPGERVLSVDENQAYQSGGTGWGVVAEALDAIYGELRLQRSLTATAIRDALAKR